MFVTKIHDIGAWVLKMACIQGKTWLDKGIEFKRISVNVSVQQLQRGNVVEVVKSALGKALDLTVIAEGVETKQQAAFLKENGCHEVQGYLYSKPVSAADLELFIKTRSLSISL